MPRFAIVKKFGPEDDVIGPREEVISIQERESARPFAVAGGCVAVPVPLGVKIGMVRGGEFDKVAGFGWTAQGKGDNPQQRPKRAGREG